jgi:nitroreductase
VEVIEALRTTGAVREFTTDPVPDEVVARLLDTARFAPSGGNRQAWRVVVVRDPDIRKGLRDCYLAPWYQYLAMGAAGLVPWAPITDRAAEATALEAAPGLAAAAVLALGWPVHRPTKLRRTGVEAFATLDRFDGPPLVGP